MLLNITPFTRINDKVQWSESIDKIKKLYPGQSISYDHKANLKETHHQFIDVQQSFLYVCTETVFDYPHAYLSEKSYKGITAKRPFVIVGAHKSLELLKTYGFKTFSPWWDESYDFEQDPSRRIEKVYSIIKDISSKSIEELKLLCTEMSEILEYNFQHYKTFQQSEILQFKLNCINNLNRHNYV